jgi:hypothetical protein
MSIPRRIRLDLLAFPEVVLLPLEAKLVRLCIQEDIWPVRFVVSESSPFYPKLDRRFNLSNRLKKAFGTCGGGGVARKCAELGYSGVPGGAMIQSFSTRVFGTLLSVPNPIPCSLFWPAAVDCAISWPFLSRQDDVQISFVNRSLGTKKIYAAFIATLEV